METTAMINLHSVLACATGEFADNVSYPERVEVSIPSGLWSEVLEMANRLPAYVQSVDISLPATEIFMDYGLPGEDHDEVDLSEYGEDCLAVSCYRLKRHAGGQAVVRLVVAAKHHDTSVEYELVADKENQMKNDAPASAYITGCVVQMRGTWAASMMDWLHF